MPSPFYWGYFSRREASFEMMPIFIAAAVVMYVCNPKREERIFWCAIINWSASSRHSFCVILRNKCELPCGPFQFVHMCTCSAQALHLVFQDFQMTVAQPTVDLVWNDCDGERALLKWFQRTLQREPRPSGESLGTVPINGSCFVLPRKIIANDFLFQSFSIPIGSL